MEDPHASGHPRNRSALENITTSPARMDPVHTETGSRPETAHAASAERGCVNCNAPCTGAYCSLCGQRQLIGRHTLRSVLRGMVERFTSSEAGFIHTARLLTLQPGAVIRGYWAGRTVRYTHPAGYLLVCVALFALAFQVVGGGTGAGEGDRVFTLLVIPFIAAASRVLFWRGQYNYAEHLIAVMYLCGHAVLGLAVLYVGASFLNGSLLNAYTVAALSVVVWYFLFGYSSAFGTRPLISALAGMTALVLGTAMWAALITLMVRWFNR